MRPRKANDIFEGFAGIFDNLAVAAVITLFTYIGGRIDLYLYEAFIVFIALCISLFAAVQIRSLKK